MRQIGLYSQHPIVNFGFKDIVVRTALAPRLLVHQIADQLHALDPDMPLAEVQIFDEIVQRQVGDKRFTTILLSSFAIAGLVLAVVGVYGVVSVVVSQRKKELAVRIALGASPDECGRACIKTEPANCSDRNDVRIGGGVGRSTIDPRFSFSDFSGRPIYVCRRSDISARSRDDCQRHSGSASLTHRSGALTATRIV
jgi:hypothetical protein